MCKQSQARWTTPANCTLWAPDLTLHSTLPATKHTRCTRIWTNGYRAKTVTSSRPLSTFTTHHVTLRLAVQQEQPVNSHAQQTIALATGAKREPSRPSQPQCLPARVWIWFQKPTGQPSNLAWPHASNKSNIVKRTLTGVTLQGVHICWCRPCMHPQHMTTAPCSRLTGCKTYSSC